MFAQRHAPQLLQKLTDQFDDEELQTLCFELNVVYDDLPGKGRANKARDLLILLERRDRLRELVTLCAQKRANVIWTYQARLFISYKRHAQTDESLAFFLQQFLQNEGHEVFIDQTMRTGTAWLEEIDKQIRSSDYLIVVISKDSADSEMLQSEVMRAYEYKKYQGYPQILPIRLSYEGLLPYSISAYLNPLQYVVWNQPDDGSKVAHNILAAIDDRLVNKEPIAPLITQLDTPFSEDGRILSHPDEHLPPLPEVDPRLLDELMPPGGAVRLRDTFYVERSADARLKQQIMRPGRIITIRAPRQSGKTSLLIRGIQDARSQGAKVVHLDLQRLDPELLTTSDDFLRYLADFIVSRLNLDPSTVDKAWRSHLGSQDKLTYLMEDFVLPNVGQGLVLAMDEVDRLLDTDFHSNFFGLLRSWHNNAAYDPRWETLNIVMVISTEPYLLIADATQSPFNVGLKLYLEDFTEAQIQFLNQRHGSPIAPEYFPQFSALLSGHPYLSRKAFYTLVTENMRWSEFLEIATSDQGPFGDHLRHQLWLLRDDLELQRALTQVIRFQRSEDDSAQFRLLKAGLIKGAGDRFICRCDLYQQYFSRKLS